MISIVMEKYVEYNDEIYYFTEGGKVISSFRNRKEAEAEVERLTKEWAKNVSVHVYCYESEELDMYGDNGESLRYDDFEQYLLKNPEKNLEFAKKLQPYYIEQCELH